MPKKTYNQTNQNLLKTTGDYSPASLNGDVIININLRDIVINALKLFIRDVKIELNSSDYSVVSFSGTVMTSGDKTVISKIIEIISQSD